MPDRYNQFLPSLRMMAVRVLGDHAAAENAAQETLGRGVLAFANGKALVRILHHILQDARTQDKLFPEALGHGVSPADVDGLRHQLHTLDEADRAILQLTYVKGLSPEDVARATDEDADFVQDRRNQLLAQLRRSLANTFERDETGVVLHMKVQTPDHQRCDVFDADGVIARYVAGISDVDETLRFEEHFVDCRRCREDVVVGAALRIAMSS